MVIRKIVLNYVPGSELDPLLDIARALGKAGAATTPGVFARFAPVVSGGVAGFAFGAWYACRRRLRVGLSSGGPAAAVGAASSREPESGAEGGPLAEVPLAVPLDIRPDAEVQARSLEPERDRMEEGRPEGEGRKADTGERGPQRALVKTAGRILRQNKLEVIKAWLSRMITEINDPAALENLPSKEVVSASLELVEGVGASLEDERVLHQFDPGGHYYQEAAKLGRLQKDDPAEMAALQHTLGELEDAVWTSVASELPQQDREGLRLGRALRFSLRQIVAAATQTYHAESSGNLDRLANLDALTGLYNRRYLMQELQRQTQVYKRYRHPFGLLMLDLDKLKAVNDTFGHAAGDSALRFLAGLMRMNTRDVDVICRFGGDEFAVIMPETDGPAAQMAGQRLAASVQHTPFNIDGSHVRLGISFGVSSCPKDGVDVDQLMRLADKGLYEAKRRRPKA